VAAAIPKAPVTARGHLLGDIGHTYAEAEHEANKPFWLAWLHERSRAVIEAACERVPGLFALGGRVQG
jgi:hypothetical protein